MPVHGNIFIERLTRADIPQILRIQNQAYSEGLREPKSLFEGIVTHSDLCVRAIVEHETAAYLMAYVSDKIRTDFEEGYRTPHTDNVGVYIHDMCVAPAFGGRGIAGALLSALEGSARVHKINHMFGIAVQDSLVFWKKQGFSAGRATAYHGESARFIAKSL